MPTQTNNFGLLKPLVNDPTDEDLWGGEINSNSDELDSLLLTCLNWPSTAETSNFSIVGRTNGTSDTGDSQKLFLCNSTSGAMTASLPAAATAGNGFIVAFKKTDASANHVTLDANGTETIDGQLTYILSTRYAFVVLQCDGTGWNVVGSLTDISGLAPLASPAFTGIPTAPTAAVGNTTTQLATTAFVDPARLLASAGYQKLSSGLIIQWGTGTTSGGNPATVTYPLAFPSACFSFVATVSGVTDGKRSAGIGSFSSSSATVYTGEGNNGNQPFNFNWMATGN